MISSSRYALILITLISLTASATAEPITGGVLSEDEWRSVESSVDRALQYLATQQQPNGSFPTLMNGQPGVTSLCVMAFGAHGHLPGEGPYGDQLLLALKFILTCQKPSGLLAIIGPGGSNVSRNVTLDVGSTAVYNHALSALVLSEVFSMSGDERENHQKAIEKAVTATLQMQTWPKRLKADKGGWRYLTRRDNKPDSDLSVTGWQVMFLRSAKNAGFDVPHKSIEDAVAYIRRCFQPRYGTFTMLANTEDRRSRGMAGAGILAMAHAGLHNSKEARLSGDWLLREGFPNYNESRHYAGAGYTDDRYHYGVFCASQAMFQLGDNYWRPFFHEVAKVVLENQQSDGSWDSDSHYMDGRYGKTYTTALMVMTLGASNQLLPIFQR